MSQPYTSQDRNKSGNRAGQQVGWSRQCTLVRVPGWLMGIAQESKVGFDWSCELGANISGIWYPVVFACELHSEWPYWHLAIWAWAAEANPKTRQKTADHLLHKLKALINSDLVDFSKAPSSPKVSTNFHSCSLLDKPIYEILICWLFAAICCLLHGIPDMKKNLNCVSQIQIAMNVAFYATEAPNLDKQLPETLFWSPQR